MKRESLFRIGLIVVLLIALAVLNRRQLKLPDGSSPTPHGDSSSLPKDDTPTGQDGSYLLCFWNVENLFDDKDDGRKTTGDAEFDRYFGNDPEALAAKLGKLCDVLIPLNGGRGPDILGVAELESERAAQLLADALNQRLGKNSYTTVLFDSSTGGRHISCALLTRLPVVKEKGKPLGRQLRILQSTIRVGDHDLVVVVSHWTSRLTDKTGVEGKGRANYADAIYGDYKKRSLAARRDGESLAYLVCGDFNDDPTDRSVAEHLHAIGDGGRVKSSTEPLLFNLFSKLHAEGEATHYHGAKPHLFDQICVSPAMLGDGPGWTVEDDSAQIVPKIAFKNGRPNRFGGPSNKQPFSARGAADHFPVTVRLRVR